MKPKTFKWAERISFFIFFLFAIVGLILSGNLLHEWSHKQDFEKVAIDGYICMLEIPDNVSIKHLFMSRMASYHWTYLVEDQEEVEKIKSYTEKKAYTLEIILILIFIASWYLILLKRFGLENEQTFKKEKFK